MQHRLLVSVMSVAETVAATRGGAHIIDAEDPVSALGVVTPLLLNDVRQATPARLRVSTNIGECQDSLARASQSALGVAMAGADIIKVGLCNLDPEAALELTMHVVRTIRHWFPGKMVVPAGFADVANAKCPSPLAVARLAKEGGAQGALIDTFDKNSGKGLLELMDQKDLVRFVEICREGSIEAWVAGSLTAEDLRRIWPIGVDVACVRGAACAPHEHHRKGEIHEDRVRELVGTIPD